MAVFKRSTVPHYASGLAPVPPKPKPNDLMTTRIDGLLRCPLCASIPMRMGGGSSSQGKVPYRTACSSTVCGITVSASSREEADRKWNTRFK